MAQDIMTRQHGAATKLLYELYIALEKKRKAKLTGVAVAAMRPAGTTKLTSTESRNQEVSNYVCFVWIQKDSIFTFQACYVLFVFTLEISYSKPSTYKEKKQFFAMSYTVGLHSLSGVQ